MIENFTTLADQPPPQPTLKAHLTVVETVYRQLPGEDPTATDSRFTRWLLTDEQVFIRKMQLDDRWRALETGWLSRAGMAELVNEPAVRHLTNPTDEQREAAERAVVEVFFKPTMLGPKNRDMHSPPDLKVVPMPHLIVLPGESARFHPADLGCIMVRCAAGEAKLIITLFPE